MNFDKNSLVTLLMGSLLALTAETRAASFENVTPSSHDLFLQHTFPKVPFLKNIAVPPVNVFQISLGSKSACGITLDGRLYCWGDNRFSQLADGTTESRWQPKPVIDPATNEATGFLDEMPVIKVIMGSENACAMNSLHKLYCWGNNKTNKLSAGSDSLISQPLAIFDTSSNEHNGHIEGKEIITFALGEGDPLASDYFCAINAKKKLFCWGDNFYGQLGINSTAAVNVPTPVYDPTTGTNSGLIDNKKIIAVALHYAHGCAINEDNKLYCWGMNNYGQLGINSTENQSIPSPIYDPRIYGVTGLLYETKVKAVAVGMVHSCAINENNKLYCWGQTRVGLNSFSNILFPVSNNDPESKYHKGLLNKAGVEKVFLGMYHTCALNNKERLYCWGQNNFGQTGLNDVSAEAIPGLIYDPATNSKTGLLNEAVITSMSLSSDNSCAINNKHELFCWGDNSKGILAHNYTNTGSEPSAVYDPATQIQSGFLGRNKVRSAALTNDDSCALNAKGKIFCWGKQKNNVSAVPKLLHVVEPESDEAFQDIKFISFAHKSSHSCAISSHKKLYCWGSNKNGQLGTNISKDTINPTPVFDPTTQTNSGLLNGKKVIGLAMDEQHTCAVNSRFQLFCWGTPNPDTTKEKLKDRYKIPVAVMDPQNAKNSGTLDGQGVKQVAMGNQHICAITKKGLLYCWKNGTSALDKNYFEFPNLPAPTTDPASNKASGLLNNKKVINVGLSNKHICALNSDGELYCLGDNTYGQLGINTPKNSSVFTAVFDPDTKTNSGFTGAKKITYFALSDNQTCAVNKAKLLYCWGYNKNNLLLTKTDGNNPVPTLIFDPKTDQQSGLFLKKKISSLSFATSDKNLLERICAIDAAQKMYCWGKNNFGQVGDGNEVGIKKMITPTIVSVSADDCAANPLFNKLGKTCYVDFEPYNRTGKYRCISPETSTIRCSGSVIK